jgi:hypothetical protein
LTKSTGVKNGYGKKCVAVGLTMVFAMSVLAGCGDNTGEIKTLTDQVAGLTKQNELLQKQVGSMSVTEVKPENSLKTVAGAVVPTFETIAGKIQFPNKLTLPDSRDDVNNSNMMVGSRFKFTPSNNWIANMNGTTLEVSHPSKIWGSIKAVIVRDGVAEDKMQPMLQAFFTGFPATTIKYRKVFMDDRTVGMIASAPIEVDAKPYVINVGFATRGENGVMTLFAYEDNKSGVQQELIDLFVGSATYGDVKIKLE